MPTLRLTARGVDALRTLPGQARTEFFDERMPGFHVRVTASGAKSYGLLYRHGRRRCRLTLASADKVTLADARDLARAALKDLANGIDPAAKKKADRMADTFDELAEQYLEKWAKPRKKSWRDDERIINNKLSPTLGKQRVQDITRADVRSLLARIATGSLKGQRKPAPIEANRTRAVLRKIFNWAISEDLAERNPVLGVPPPGIERQRDRVLNDGEIRAIWDELDNEHPLIAAIFRLLLLSAQRRGEVLSMRWEDVDFNTAWWTIPGERAKNGLPHRVPLSTQALAVLDDVRRENPKSRWVFPSPKGNTHIGTVQKAVERLRNSTEVEFRLHDFRRTAASHMTSMGISRLTVSKILNHVEQGVTRVYDRHSYDPEKREALEMWSAQLETIVVGEPGATVLPFARY